MRWFDRRADELLEGTVECPLLALSGHHARRAEYPLLGVKRTLNRLVSRAFILWSEQGVL